MDLFQCHHVNRRILPGITRFLSSNIQDIRSTSIHRIHSSQIYLNLQIMPPRLYIQPLVLSAPPLTSQTTHLISAFTSLTLRPQPHHPLQNPLCQPQSQRHASILASLSDTPGAYNRRIRRGRGASSGKGKTSGRGHKGQKQHGKVPFRSHLGRFNGGQTPVEWVHSKRGFENKYVASFRTQLLFPNMHEEARRGSAIHSAMK